MHSTTLLSGIYNNPFTTNHKEYFDSKYLIARQIATPKAHSKSHPLPVIAESLCSHGAFSIIYCFYSNVYLRHRFFHRKIIFSVSALASERFGLDTRQFVP
jgi:hypothetical protein